MKIEIGGEVDIELRAIASMAGCHPSHVVAIIVREGFQVILSNATLLRQQRNWKTKRFDSDEPTREDWRAALDLDKEPPR